MRFDDRMREDARLRMLQALANQTDSRLSDRMLVHHLEAWGHRPTREYVRTQLRALAALHAVRIMEDTPAVMVAELMPAGIDHVQRRGILDGVLRPEPGE